MDSPKNDTPPLENDEYLVRCDGVDRRLVLAGNGKVRMSGRDEETFELLQGNPALGEFSFLFRNTVYHVVPHEPSEEDPTSVSFRLNGMSWKGNVDDKRSLLAKRYGTAKEGRSGETAVKAPMPGLVTKVLVKEGDTVPRGEGLLVLEAMKMENELLAEHSGRIVRIECSEGQPVEKNAHLLIIHYEL